MHFAADNRPFTEALVPVRQELCGALGVASLRGPAGAGVHPVLLAARGLDGVHAGLERGLVAALAGAFGGGLFVEHQGLAAGFAKGFHPAVQMPC